MTRQFANRGGHYPQGTKDDDRFVGYKAGAGGVLFLQFRDDLLINFDTKEFQRNDAFVYNVFRSDTAAH